MEFRGGTLLNHRMALRNERGKKSQVLDKVYHHYNCTVAYYELNLYRKD